MKSNDLHGNWDDSASSKITALRSLFAGGADSRSGQLAALDASMRQSTAVPPPAMSLVIHRLGRGGKEC